MGVSRSSPHAEESKADARELRPRQVVKPLFEKAAAQPLTAKSETAKVDAKKETESAPGDITLDAAALGFHKTNLEYLTRISNHPFAPYDEVTELGINDDGESEYEFYTGAGERVHQWYTEEGYPILETVDLNDGTQISRRYFENSSKVQEVTYHGTDGYRRMWFTGDDGYEALETGGDTHRTNLYRYNETGGVREIWENNNGNWNQIH